MFIETLLNACDQSGHIFAFLVPVCSSGALCFRMRRATMPLCVRHAIIGLAAMLATCLANPADAMRHRDAQPVETVETRTAGAPLMAIVSLGNQRVTIYDADGWILRAPVSSGQTGYETPAGVYRSPRPLPSNRLR
jgi:hypothetical protein